MRIDVLLGGQWLRWKLPIHWRNADEQYIWCQMDIFYCSTWPLSFDFCFICFAFVLKHEKKPLNLTHYDGKKYSTKSEPKKREKN